MVAFLLLLLLAVAIWLVSLLFSDKQQRRGEATGLTLKEKRQLLKEIAALYVQLQILKRNNPNNIEILWKMIEVIHQENPEKSEDWAFEQFLGQVSEITKEVQLILDEVEQEGRAAHPKDVSKQAQVKLFAMVNGNMRTATRLLNQIRQGNPGRSEQWIWEKCIFDLERDRR